jgi:hypothetical protein
VASAIRLILNGIVIKQLPNIRASSSLLKLRIVGFPAKMVARSVSEGGRTTGSPLAYASGYQKCATSKLITEELTNNVNTIEVELHPAFRHHQADFLKRFPVS